MHTPEYDTDNFLLHFSAFEQVAAHPHFWKFPFSVAILVFQVSPHSATHTPHPRNKHLQAPLPVDRKNLRQRSPTQPFYTPPRFLYTARTFPVPKLTVHPLSQYYVAKLVRYLLVFPQRTLMFLSISAVQASFPEQRLPQIYHIILSAFVLYFPTV